MTTLSCFKAYDIRGKLGEEINEDIVYKIGRAYSEIFKPKIIVVGNDTRLTSENLKQALIQGLIDSGIDVLDIGMSGTEEIYFATSYLDTDGGIEITASHNPLNYNGMKLVRQQSRPISINTGLLEIQKLVQKDNFSIPTSARGNYNCIKILEEYVDHLMSYINLTNFLNPITVLLNPGNGTAGHVIDAIERRFIQANVPVKFITINHQPNGNFPKGIPNPLLPECRQDTIDAVRAVNADIGIAFDGDFDRCFLFDKKGNFIDSYYIIGLLADFFLNKEPYNNIIHDPRLIWNTIDIINKASGTPIMVKTGHAFFKEYMRKKNAIYGGEISAHHYFRDFFYCDSGMIPWLLIIEIMAIRNLSIDEMIYERVQTYPISGEITLDLNDIVTTIPQIKKHYETSACNINNIDGLSITFDNWRFNLRISNTEPVMRLNIESRGDQVLIKNKIKEILSLIKKS